MGIAVRTRPELVVVGTVTSSRQFIRKTDGEVLGSNVVIDTAGGGTAVTCWASDGIDLSQRVGHVVALVATPSEREGRTDLNAVRLATANDVDKLVSAAGVK